MEERCSIYGLEERLFSLVSASKEVEEEIQEIIHSVRRYTEKLELLMNVGALLNSSLHTSEVRRRAISISCDLMECKASTLYLIDPEKNELYFETIVGDESANVLKEIRLPINEESIAGSVALFLEPLIINDVASDQRHFKPADVKSKFKTQNMICVPVFAKDTLVGVLQAMNRAQGSFDQEDLTLFRSLANKVGMAVENAALYESLQASFTETVGALASAIDARDQYTGGHSKRVAFFSTLIAKYLGLADEEIEEIRMGALLHDIGKIGVRDNVLLKGKELDKDEWEHMRKHPEFGFQIVGHVPTLKKVAEGMRFHHERPDGKGYPLGLKGDEIPLVASIISVADTFDAMTTNRPYRKGMPYETAVLEISKNKGTQFDEKVVDAFVEAFKNEGMGKKRLLNKRGE